MENDKQILEALLGVYKNSPRELKSWQALGAQHLTETGSSQGLIKSSVLKNALWTDLLQ